MKAAISIKLARIEAKPPLRALADVTVLCECGEITIHRCAIFEKPGEPPWASLPRIPVERHGNRRFVPLVDLSRDLKKEVVDALLDAYRGQPDREQASSPGTSDQSASNLTGLRTGDGVREEMPGGPSSRDRRKRPAEN